MCKIHRIHYSINTLNNCVNKITECIVITRKSENATVCVSFFVGYIRDDAQIRCIYNND